MQCVEMTGAIGTQCNITLLIDQQLIYAIYSKPSTKLEPSDSYHIYYL